MARQGHQLVLSARDKERLESLLTELEGDTHIPIALDVSCNADILTAWDAIRQTFGGIDLIIYCAGYYKPLNVVNMKLAEMESMLDVNLRGAMRVICAVVPYFLSINSGHIVLIGSVAGYRGLPNSMGYGLSKAAVIHFAENLKCDLSTTNICVQVINPGFVKTRLTDLNTFKMPFLISTEEAAKDIVTALRKKTFESHFPYIFGVILKILAFLPYKLYFAIIKKITNKAPL